MIIKSPNNPIFRIFIKMKIGIELRTTSYLPEALAYKNYLERNGHRVQLVQPSDFDSDNDINIFFMGFTPFWEKSRSKSKIIHEYSSLSTAPFPKIKDIIKQTFMKKPNGRIFTETVIKEKLNFQDNIPYIFRDVGVEAGLFSRINRNIQYDIVYCGSITGRPGLIKQINHLCNLGFTFVIIGKITQKDKAKLAKSKNITFTGPLDRGSIKNIYQSCRFGLNYTPNIYPFNIQTSIKTLEYLACGMPVISNRYKWVIDFSEKNNSAKFIWLDNIKYPLESSELSSVLDEKYCWDYILEKANLNAYLQYIVEKT